MSTPLTEAQYADLIKTLCMLQNTKCDLRDAIRIMQLTGHITPFAFIYLVQWFYRIKFRREWLPYMINELVIELVNLQPVSICASGDSK